MSAAEQLNKLLEELDDDSLDKLSDDEVLELRKKLNPYGRTIEGSDKILTFSYTDLQAEYLTKLLTTTMIGFLNRMCDEWRVPPDVPVVTVHDYLKDPSKLDEYEKTLQKPELMAEAIAENKKTMLKRVAIKEFLEDMFQYNPDLHVRSAYRPNYKDPERTVLDTPAAQLAIYKLKKTDSDFLNSYTQYIREQEKKNEKEEKKESMSESKLKVVKQITEMIPPTDVFHRFKYYFESNYETVKEITNDLYCDKPCFEKAVNPYSWHNDIDEADKFISKHKDEVITTIFKAHSGKWNIIAPYTKVRESMRYFNKKTAVLEEIAKQIESDAKMGSELMKKRIKINKKKNIEKEGPDDPAFVKWKKSNDTLKNMGAETVEYDDDDCLEVPVFRVSDGGAKISQTKFYTEAVAPEIPEDRKPTYKIS